MYNLIFTYRYDSKYFAYLNYEVIEKSFNSLDEIDEYLNENKAIIEKISFRIQKINK